jgi:hypothetical protein
MILPSRIRLFSYITFTGILFLFLSKDLTIESAGQVTVFALFLTLVYSLITRNKKNQQ